MSDIDRQKDQALLEASDKAAIRALALFAFLALFVGALHVVFIYLKLVIHGLSYSIYVGSALYALVCGFFVYLYGIAKFSTTMKLLEVARSSDISRLIPSAIMALIGLWLISSSLWMSWVLMQIKGWVVGQGVLNLVLVLTFCYSMLLFIFCVPMPAFMWLVTRSTYENELHEGKYGPVEVEGDYDDDEIV